MFARSAHARVRLIAPASTAYSSHTRDPFELVIATLAEAQLRADDEVLNGS